MMRWIQPIVAVIVAVVLLVTLALDLTLEFRPKGGWLYLCRAEAPTGGGKIAAVRYVYDRAGEQDRRLTVRWYVDGNPQANPEVIVEWFAGFGTAGRALTRGDVVLHLRKVYDVGADPTLALLGADNRARLPANYAAYGRGEFDLATLLAFAGDRDSVRWVYAGKGSRGPLSVIGTIDVMPLRAAAAAMPGVVRRVDAMAARYKTACVREPAVRPAVVI